MSQLTVDWLDDAFLEKIKEGKIVLLDGAKGEIYHGTIEVL